MPIVHVYLTKYQQRNLNQGKGVKFNSRAGKTDLCQVDLDAKNFKKYNTALLKQKGCILKGNVIKEQEEEMEGGSIANKFKKFGKTLKKGINNGVVDVIEKTKDVIPQKVAEQIMQRGVQAGVLAGTTFLGSPQPELANRAGNLSKAAVTAGYDTNFRQRGALKKLAKNYVNEVKDDLIDEGVSYMMGDGLKKRAGRMVKGSDEAKAWAARMRELRQQKKGAGLLSNVKDKIQKYESITGKGMTPLGRGMTPLGGRGFVPL